MQMICIKGIHRRGFTLVELLTVIAVVGILAAVIFSAYGGVRQRQQQASCAANMRQLGAAILLHANDHEGRFPLTMHSVTDVEESWVYTLAPYLENVDQVRICPADPKAEERLERGQSSYILNEFVFVPALDPLGRPTGQSYDRLAKLPFPGNTPLAFVISDQRGLSAANDHTHSRGWSSWGRVVADIQPNRFSAGESDSSGRNGHANYLYADGHVASIDAETLYQQVQSGRNPAHPDPSQQQ